MNCQILPEEVLTYRQQLSPTPDFPEYLESRHIRLEVLDPARHTEQLYAACNGSGSDGSPNAYDADEEIWRYMFNGPFSDLASFRNYIYSLYPIHMGLALVVIDRASNKPIGMANYCSNAPEMMRVEIGGVWYSPRFQRSYANTQTIYLMLRHAFDTLGYRRVEWKCNTANERSRIAAQRLGFTYEGTFRQHMIIKGRNRDTAWFAMTDGDWPEARTKLEMRIAR